MIEHLFDYPSKGKLPHRVTGREHGQPAKGVDMAKRTCSVDGCERTYYARGWCQMHYARWLNHGDAGDPEPQLIYGSVEDRILGRIVRSGECWVWAGCIRPDGYGAIGVDGKTELAHRASYRAFVGPIPDHYHLDHLCRNRACVNPLHLEPVTQRENNRRGESPLGKKARQTHCHRGHVFDEENTYVTPKGNRACRRCRRMVDRNRRPIKTKPHKP